MTIVDTFSVMVGSAVILMLLGSIAVEGIRRRGTSKKKIIPTIDSKWQKIEVRIDIIFFCY
jgi:hypothetical protein